MSIHLGFHGASGTVTGSCYLLETAGKRVLVDCGMFQGSRSLAMLNEKPFPFDAARLDAVLLTHAHIDHSGLLPKLTAAGYTGPIYATASTNDLLQAMLPDSAHIQESDAESQNRRNRRRGRPMVVPIYTIADAEACLKQLKDGPFETYRAIVPGIRARWWNSGHLLGSGSIELEAGEGAERRRILFSGDIGPDNKPFLEDPEAPAGFDVVLCESTYGNRDRIEVTDALRKERLTAEIRRAHAAGGAMLIPSFAVERTQELVADIVGLMDEGVVPKASLFVDSPLALKATEVFRRHSADLENGAAMLRALASPHLHVTQTVDESKALAQFKGFHIIIAASGMCDAGRIRHHLRNWLPDRRASVMLVGYQAQGSLGRVLQEGAKAVRIFGDDVIVNAHISALETYSGHADGPELASWIKERLPIRQGLFLTHGEDESIGGLRQRVLEAGLLSEQQIFRPMLDDVYDLGPKTPQRLQGRGEKRRVEPQVIAQPDSENELSKLMLDINSAMYGKADEKRRAALVRKLRQALETDEG